MDEQRYIIVTHADPTALAEQVSAELGRGYILAGPLVVSEMLYHQPMVMQEYSADMMALRLMSDKSTR